METSHSFERHCFGDICHCDFRVSITGCEESEPARIINIINIVLCGLMVIIGFGLIYHRIIVNGYKFMDYNPKKGLLRPKPIDSMLLFITIFGLIRCVCSTVLILDVASENMAFRSYIYEGAFHWALTAFTLYLIGIAQTLAESHKAIANSWLPSPFIVDVVGFSIIFTTYIINTILNIGAGLMAQSNLRVAEIFVQVNYIVWFALTTTVAFSVLYCGSRLVSTLQSHIQRFTTTNERYFTIKNGIFKIRIMMGLIISCLLAYAGTVFVFGVLRITIIDNHGANIFFCLALNMLAPVTMLCIEVSILFNPTVSSHLKELRLKSSGEEKSTSLNATQSNSKMESHTTNQSTSTHLGLDELKSKYEDVVKNTIVKTNNGGSASLNTNFHHTKKEKELHVEDSEGFEAHRSESQIHLIHT